MYARITPYKLKVGARASALDLMEALRPEILALPGMNRFVNVLDADGSGYTIAFVDSLGMDATTLDRVNALWSRFADHLEATPTPHGFEIVADWTA